MKRGKSEVTRFVKNSKNAIFWGLFHFAPLYQMNQSKLPSFYWSIWMRMMQKQKEGAFLHAKLNQLRIPSCPYPGVVHDDLTGAPNVSAIALQSLNSGWTVTCILQKYTIYNIQYATLYPRGESPVPLLLNFHPHIVLPARIDFHVKLIRVLPDEILQLRASHCWR